MATRQGIPFQIDYRHILKWPGLSTPEYRRISDAYKADISKTWKMLGREMAHLRLQGTVTVGLDSKQYDPPGSFRIDGSLPFPGVVLAFRCQFGLLRFCCERHTTWHANLHSIAVTLKALRELDKHGATDPRRLYIPWRLNEGGDRPRSDQTKGAEGSKSNSANGGGQTNGAKKPEPPPPADLKAACSFLSLYSNETAIAILRSAEAAKRAYRSAVFKLHPDRVKGGHNVFVRLQALWAVVERHHKL